MHPQLLDSLAPIIADPLASHFAKLLKIGVILSDWSTTTATLIYKKVPKYDAANYKPGSFTLICYKDMGHFVHDSIPANLVRNKFMNNSHHSFTQTGIP